MKKYILLAGVAPFVVTMACGSALFASPVGGNVVAGSANVAQVGKTTNITQNSSKVILDWSSFDIASDEAVNFIQPSSSALALNRIKDTKPSQIDGQLSANGHVILINPNGVVFGNGSKVDAASLTVSSADIDNDDFMNGVYHFNQAGNSDATIENNGLITVKDAGLVNFVAPNVVNNGVIQASLGTVTLAGAEIFTMDLAGDELITVAVADEDVQKMVHNTGSISVDGAQVVMTAAKARSLMDSIVDNSGVIEANSLTNVGGKILLTADSGYVKTSGTITANGKLGGGEILIGGDYQGQGDVVTASRTEATSASVTQANATTEGDGGKVIFWADDKTYFYGSLSATGGSVSGNGGFAEISGKEYLAMHGVADLSADYGELGTLLLDPRNITIVSGTAGSSSDDTNPLADNSVAAGDDSGVDWTLSTGTIESLVASSNLILKSEEDIIVNASFDANVRKVTFVAGDDIEINADITNLGETTLTAVDQITGSGNLISGVTTETITLTSAYIDRSGSISNFRYVNLYGYNAGSIGVGDNASGYENYISGQTIDNISSNYLTVYGDGTSTSDVIINHSGLITINANFTATDAENIIIDSDINNILGRVNLVAYNTISGAGDITSNTTATWVASHYDLTGTNTINGDLRMRFQNDGTVGIGDNVSNLDNTISNTTLSNLYADELLVDYSDDITYDYIIDDSAPIVFNQKTSIYADNDALQNIIIRSDLSGPSSWVILQALNNIIFEGDSTLDIKRLTLLANTIDINGRDVKLLSDIHSYSDPIISSVAGAGSIQFDSQDVTNRIYVAGGFGDLDLSTPISLVDASVGKIILGDENRTGIADITGWNLSANTYDVDVYGGSVIADNVSTGTGDYLLKASAGAITIGSSGVTTTANSLTLQSPSLVMNGAISGTGDVVLLPLNTTDTIGVGSAAGDYTVTDAKLAMIDVDGTVQIGAASHNADIMIDTVDTSSKVNTNYAVMGNNVTIDGTWIVGGAVYVESHNSGDVILNATVQSNASGDAVVMNTGNDFINNFGIGAIDPLSGRFLVYAADATNLTINGLDADYVYETTYPTSVLASGNRYVLSAAAPIEVVEVEADPVISDDIYDFVPLLQQTQYYDVKVSSPKTKTMPVIASDSATTSTVSAAPVASQNKIIYVSEPVSEYYDICQYSVSYCM